MLLYATGQRKRWMGVAGCRSNSQNATKFDQSEAEKFHPKAMEPCLFGRISNRKGVTEWRHDVEQWQSYEPERTNDWEIIIISDTPENEKVLIILNRSCFW